MSDICYIVLQGNTWCYTVFQSAEMPTSRDLKSGDGLFLFPPPGISMIPPSNIDLALNGNDLGHHMTSYEAKKRKSGRVGITESVTGCCIVFSFLHSVPKCYKVLHSVTLLHSVTQCYIVLDGVTCYRFCIVLHSVT